MFLYSAASLAFAAPSQVHLALAGAEDVMAVSWKTDRAVAAPTVQWRAPGASTTSGTAAALDTRTYLFHGTTSGYYHHAEMAALRPDTDMEYRVGSDSSASADDGWTAWLPFRSARAAADHSGMSMIFTGDFGFGGAGPPANEGQCTADAWAALAAGGGSSGGGGAGGRRAPDLVWVSGDIAYANMHGAKDFEATWDDWFERLQPTFSRIPAMVSPGNHETYVPGIIGAGGGSSSSTTTSTSISTSTTGVVAPPDGWLTPGAAAFDADALEAGADTSWNFTAFDARFRMPSGRGSGGARSMWYSVDVGGVHIVSIDTETDFPGAAEAFMSGWGDQLAWLRADLAAFRASSPDGWLVAIGHKPMYSSAPGYVGSAETLNLLATFEPLFAEHGVDLYLAGHQHGYERSAPVVRQQPAPPSAAGTRGNGTVHIVAAVPGGGCGITADWANASNFTVSQWPTDGSPWNDRHDGAEEEASLGYGLLDATPTELRWRFVLSASGRLVDAYNITRQ